MFLNTQLPMDRNAGKKRGMGGLNVSLDYPLSLTPSIHPSLLDINVRTIGHGITEVSTQPSSLKVQWPMLIHTMIGSAGMDHPWMYSLWSILAT